MNIPSNPTHCGKVRDIYDLGDTLLLVATDRISAYDNIIPSIIPDKGRILTGLSEFWFHYLNIPHHLITTDLNNTTQEYYNGHSTTIHDAPEYFHGRSMIVKKANVIPFEIIIRGYITGSAWTEYSKTGTILDQSLPTGLKESDRIDPIFTPTTKAPAGSHDTPITRATMARAIGDFNTNIIQSMSTKIYNTAAEHANKAGLILADTKLEWGYETLTGNLLLIDEILTPDSSRYWILDNYTPGAPQQSFDKQYVRDWVKFNENQPLPQYIINVTRSRYITAYERLTGNTFK